MALAVNIVLADAQATPVNRTFIPMGRDDKGVMHFEDQSAPTPLGFWRISIELIRPKPGSAGASAQDRVTRAKIWLHEPVLEVVGNTAAGYTAPPTIAYIPRSGVEYIISDRGTILDRRNLRKMTADLQDNVQVVSLVEQFISLT